MKIIDKQQAMSLILGEGKAINGEEYIQYYKRFIDFESYTAYETDGCIAIKDEYDYEGKHILRWNLHTVNAVSDIVSAFETVKNYSAGGEIQLFVIGDVPAELSSLQKGWVKFSRYGQSYEDNGIRIITAEDRQSVADLCTVPDDDNWFAKTEAETLIDEYNHIQDISDMMLLGAFDDNKPDTLIGLISLRKSPDISLAGVGDLLVRKEYRNRGYAKRLILAACGVCPGIEYFYNSNSKNSASMAAARSAGFKYAGTCLYYENK
jgi:GNAT superfamily N-acetyltransferase